MGEEARMHVPEVDLPIVVAELSGNHNGSLQRALDLVRAIAGSGATHLKLQTYTADTITLDIDREPFLIPADHPLWGGRTLYSLYKEAHTPWEWHRPIFDLARDLGLVPFSSPFDPTAVDFLESLDVTLYKVASMEIGDLPLIREIGRTGKPVVISTGTASLADIDRAVEAAQSAGAASITLLVCTSAYPAPPEEANLRRILTLREAFGVPVGLSDHTLGIGVSVAATALGASMIEKHVTLSRADGGVDAEFSAEP
ncbi:MAG: pseudaminic acid synthase, partial [Actinomycetes bacterium]